MKRDIIITVLSAAVLATACQTPMEVAPTTTALGMTSVSAIFLDDPRAADPTAVFTTPVTSFDNDIVIEIPWFFPEDTDNLVTDITRMRVTASIDYNCFIKPAMVVLDLTKPNKFVFTDGRGVKHDIVIRGEIRKLSKKQLVDFSVTSPSLTSLIDEAAHTVTISYTEGIDLSACEVDYTISPHATCSLDGMAKVNFNTTPKITVTAHDGSTCDYTVILSNETPVKIPYGFDPASASKLWFTDMVGLGIDRMPENITSLAVVGRYLVVSAGNGSTPIYLNKSTGSKIGTINIGSASAGFIKNDDAGNMLICNHTDGEFKIWRTKSVTEAPTLLLSYTNTTGYALGSKLSVQGNIDSEAIIVSPFEGNSLIGCTQTMAYWTITGGVVSDIHIVALSGFVGVGWANGFWNTAPETIPAITPLGTKLSDGFLFSVYDENCVYSINGSFVMTKILTPFSDSGNFNVNTIDAKWFNNAHYAIILAAGFFPAWGGVSRMYIYDISNLATVSGTIDKSSSIVLNFTGDSFFVDGGGAGGGVAGAADAILVPSSDGYYLSLYYIDHNNRVLGAYQVDCIDD